MEEAMSVTCKKISPMLAAADMRETLAFYHDVLGFQATMKSAEYSIVERDGQTIHFKIIPFTQGI
jgi:catechol 2,3-dioxygenase-like lactoylglutathione lyase family enzyme